MKTGERIFRVLLLSFSITAFLTMPAFAVDWDIETIDTNGSGDVTDDPCLWLHATDPTKSVILGTNKTSSTNGGLYAYNLSGTRAGTAGAWDATNWFNQGKKTNNVDIRYNFDAGGTSWDIVACSNRTNDRVDLYKVDTTVGGDFAGLTNVGSFSTSSLGGDNPYGLAMYHSKSQDKHYVITSSKSGTVGQWELSYSAGAIIGTNVWQANVSASEIEGVVADDENDVVYIAGEDTAIYRYKTSAGTIVDAGRVTVDTAGGGNLVADIEGLTMYYAADGKGYLIASSQGSNNFDIYDREYSGTNANAHISFFSVTDGVGSDNVTGTDGIDITNVNLGGDFAEGMFIAHDTNNAGGSASNLKLVGWDSIAGETLLIDTSWDPRSVPEPASMTLLALGGLAVLRRRRTIKRK